MLEALEPALWGCAAAGEGWLASLGVLSSVVPVGGCLCLICGAELPPALLAVAQNPAVALVLPDRVCSSGGWCHPPSAAALVQEAEV